MLNRLGWIIMLLLAGCAQETKNAAKYFDFDKLIDDQIILLANNHRQLKKSASLGETPKDTVFRPSAEEWNRELEAFRLLETINKPAFQKLYHIDDALSDTKSNLKIRQFSTDKSRVALIKLFYHNDLSQLKKIECVLFQKNFLYASSDQLTLQFDDIDGRIALTGYTMHGYQKMLLSDTVRFTVQGLIE